MDEPSEGLAPTIIEHLIETFRTLEEEGLAILLIEQNLGMATAIAERQLVMVAGSIAAETTATELSDDPELQRRYLGVEPLAEHVLVATRRPARDARHEGRGVRVPARPAARARRRRRSLVDAGIHEPVGVEPDVSRDEVARAAGADVAALAAAGDRGAAVTAMAAGAEQVVQRAPRRGRLDGILALGGSGGSSIATRAMRALPVGVPKLMVSTVASGDTRPYVGAVDVTMMYSVVDIAGVNRVSARIMANAAGAIAGMVGATVPELEEKPLVGATMFGVTTPCVTRARERLEELGYEVLVFHATGAGGQSMEALVRDGFLAGVLDTTTTELADELVGGVLSAGPDRLEAAGAAGVPQVVSLGALDMVNFGPRETRARRSSRAATSTCTTRP